MKFNKQNYSNNQMIQEQKQSYTFYINSWPNCSINLCNLGLTKINYKARILSCHFICQASTFTIMPYNTLYFTSKNSDQQSFLVRNFDSNFLDVTSSNNKKILQKQFTDETTIVGSMSIKQSLDNNQYHIYYNDQPQQWFEVLSNNLTLEIAWLENPKTDMTQAALDLNPLKFFTNINTNKIPNLNLNLNDQQGFNLTLEIKEC